jgi:hypothetical protein
VNNKIIVVMMLAGMPFLSGSRVSAQTATEQEIELLRKDIRSQKKELIALNLSLTATEATKFWPVYDQYQSEYRKIGDAKVALITEYAQNWGTITDDQALNYLKRSEEISESVIQLRNKYVPLVNQILPGKKTATFFQLERRIELLVEVQLASQIPLLVKSQGQ